MLLVLRNMKYLPLLVSVLLMASCGNEQNDTDNAGPELVHMEGEFRINSGAAQFMNCDNYKNFRAVSPGMKSIELSYNNFIAIPGDPIKMWISGYVDAQDVSGSGLLDSVVVIGANRGIGLALCEQYHKAGNQVTALCRKSSEELEQIGCRIVEGIDLQSDDLPQQLHRMLSIPKIDILIHNAGILHSDRFPVATLPPRSRPGTL